MVPTRSGGGHVSNMYVVSPRDYGTYEVGRRARFEHVCGIAERLWYLRGREEGTFRTCMWYRRETMVPTRSGGGHSSNMYVVSPRDYGTYEVGRRAQFEHVCGIAERLWYLRGREEG